ncbi:MAG: molybdenum cofactor guanylyltransferase [Gammaproteobacteria bacterium]|nr:molybdenum cofactor guanylyltransferase [Gammaproteobacteria bacterium]
MSKLAEIEFDVAAVILAGGEARRMGGTEKGLQVYRSKPLIEHTIDSLHGQVGQIVISANRHHEQYQTYGYAVYADEFAPAEGGSAGPLAGIYTALQHVDTGYLLSVPCDVPNLPLDLVISMTALLNANQNAKACVLYENGRMQQIICLYRVSIKAKLYGFLQQDKRCVAEWVDRCAPVRFERTEKNNPLLNINTLEELQC